ncbi:MAG TPA: tetratricopeptide repeat protein, partial [Casimicrobiaceae bacterium]|nr:tetratricopeptide repeat protein [Casimicrobiaceae bacterium]
MSAAGSATAVALREASDALARGDAQHAETRCRDALALDTRDASAWTLLGAILRQRDPAAARAAFDRALECDPAHADALFHLGNLHREQKRYGEAIGAYERALALVPAHASILNNLGLALQRDGQREAAEAAYRAALAARPGQRQALANLAHLLCSARRY